MNEDESVVEYDEEEAVKFIQNYLPQDLKGKFSDDEIVYIIDIIYEYYDDQGLLRDDVTDEELQVVEDDKVVDYVYKVTKKDQFGTFTKEEIIQIMLGELSYCDRF